MSPTSYQTAPPRSEEANGRRGRLLPDNDVAQVLWVVGDLLVAVIGDDEAVTYLCSEGPRHADLTVDCQHHSRLKHGGVAENQLGLLQEAVAGCPSAPERVIEAGVSDHLGVGRVHGLRRDPGA